MFPSKSLGAENLRYIISEAEELTATAMANVNDKMSEKNGSNCFFIVIYLLCDEQISK